MQDITTTATTAAAAAAAIVPPDINSLSLEDGVPGSAQTPELLSAPLPPPPPPPHPSTPYFASPTWNGHLLTLEYNENYREFIKKSEPRIAYQLAYLYNCDVNPSLSNFYIDKIQEKDILIINDYEDNPIYYLFAFNILKAQLKSSKSFMETIKTHGIDTRVLIISHEFPIDIELQTKIQQFVESGGALLCFQTACALIDKIWPQLIKYKNGVTTGAFS